MRVFDFPQRSPEWYSVRSGVPTASEFDKIVTMKGERSKQREKYLYRLAGEKVSGIVEESFQSAAMERGVKMEAEARDIYQFITGNEVEQVGFCLHDDGFGCSPDGLVGKDGMIEIKCPSVHTHVEYLLNGSLPSDYFQQVHGQLLTADRKWCDFVSYYPGIRPLIVRVNSDKQFSKALHAELALFCTDLQTIINKIK
jgi:putative phage-type endonuclease